MTPSFAPGQIFAESNASLRAAISASMDPAVHVDQQLRILERNSAFVTAFGSLDQLSDDFPGLSAADTLQIEDWALKLSGGKAEATLSVGALTLSGCSLPDGTLLIYLRRTISTRVQSVSGPPDADSLPLLEALPAVICRLDRQLRYRWISGRFDQWFTATAQDRLGLAVPEIMAAEEFEPLRVPFQRALSGETLDVEYSRPRRGGGEIELQIWLTPDRSSDGDIIGVLALLLDISERKQLARKLEEQEERLRVAIDGAKLGIWELDPQTSRLTWSDRVRECFGMYPDEEIDLVKNFAAIHPEDRARVQVTVAAALDPEGTGHYDVEFRTIGLRDSKVRWIHATGRAHFADGKAIRFVGTVRDVTSRKLAEQALRSSEERLTLALQASNVIGTWDYDVSADQLTCDDRWAKTYSPDGDTSGRAYALSEYLAVVHADDRDRLQAAIRRALETGEQYSVEYRVIRRDGEVRWIYARGRCQTNQDGREVRFPGAWMDITERKRAEDERERLLRELQRSNGELEQFSHIVSHDLETPLRTVTGYLQLLQRKFKSHLDEDATEMFSMARDASTRMAAMIRGLLSYAQAGHSKIEQVPVSLNKAVEAAINNLQAAINDAGAVIRVGALPVVVGDELQLMQLVQNLVSNAIKYRSLERRPEVHIGAIQNVDGCVLSVADNGEGIDRQHFAEVFKPLSRLHGTEISGTGIGLAVCQRIAERLGGRIWIESEPGLGSTFFVSLPCARG